MSIKSRRAFKVAPNRTIALIGPGRVRKTTLALRFWRWKQLHADPSIWDTLLRPQLQQHVDDLLVDAALESPKAAKILELKLANSVTLEPKLGGDHWATAADFMGMLGDPDLGGRELEAFLERMDLYCDAEVDVMYGLESELGMLERGGSHHTVIDTSSSLCQVLRSPHPLAAEVIRFLTYDCYTVYLSPTPAHVLALIDRVKSDPRPYFYPREFISAQLPGLQEHFGVNDVSACNPAEVTAYLFPILLRERIRLYRKLVEEIGGVTVRMDAFDQCDDVEDILRVIARAIPDNSEDED